MVQTTRLKWLGLAAGQEGELKKLEQTTIGKNFLLRLKSVCGTVRLWPRILREEAARTVRWGGRR